MKKTKQFIIPILSLVIISIFSIFIITSYINIHTFKQHIKKEIKSKKEIYLQKHKDKIYRQVHLVDNSINFFITQIEKQIERDLKKRIKISLNMANHIYTTQKGEISDDEIRQKIVKHLGAIKFGENRDYFIYDKKSEILLGDIAKKSIKIFNNSLEKKKIGFSKLRYDDSDNFRIICVSRFEPLDIIIGTQKCFAEAEKNIKKRILERFQDFKLSKNNYLFFLELHNIDGGDDFATIILNPSKSNLVGKKLNENSEDAKGQKFRKKLLKELKTSGESYIKYWYKEIDSQKIKPKISYYYLQKNWNWIITSGFYFDNLEKEIAKMENSINQYTKEAIFNSMLWVLFLLSIVIFISIYISFKINRTIKSYTDKLVLNEKEKKLDYQSKLSQMIELTRAIGIQDKYQNLETSIKQITEISSLTLNISRVSVWIYQKNQTELDCLDLYSLKNKNHTSELNINGKKNLNYLKVLQSNKILAIDDVEKNDITLEFRENYLKPLNIKSMLDISIKSEGKIIGIVSYEQTNKIKKWSQDEMDFSKAISNSISLLLEIEHRKKTDLLLTKKNEEQNILLSLFDIGDSVLFNWNNDEQWSVKSVSVGVKNLLGYKKENFESGEIDYKSCIHKDDLDRICMDIENLNNSNAKFFKHNPYRLITKMGEVKWVLDYTVVVKENGKINNYIGYLSDITEARLKEEQYMQQSRLAQMGEMIGMIAHQWRQPLGAINSAVIGIQTKLDLEKFDLDLKEDREKFMRFLNRKHKNIYKYVEDLSQTIDDFRNFFKPNQDKKLIHLTTPIKRALSIVETSMSSKTINITKDFQNNDKIWIYQNEIMQVILNILKNSEDNFKDKNKKNKKIHILTKKQNDTYIIELSDNGGGIDKNIIDKIFDPYFSTKDEKNGTGLGLYMSKIMIEEHNKGQLKVFNNQNGAVFSIILKSQKN